MTVIVIRPDGKVEGLYNDIIPLNQLGTLNVKRATNIEFCFKRQKWIVSLPNGEEVYSNGSREKALDWEKVYCERLLLSGYRVEA